MTAPTIAELKELVQRQANMLVAAGTGELLIKDGDLDYKRVDAVVTASLRRLELRSPFPWRSLGEWHGFYSQGSYPTYASRRLHIASLANPAIEQLTEIEGTGSVHDPGSDDTEPTWNGINTRISGLIQKYSTARVRDDWQDVGRRSREILIDLGKLVADPSLVPVGEQAPKVADAKAWFNIFVGARASGNHHAELRFVMKGTWDLAQKVTHGDLGDIDAYAAAQATVMVVRTSQKLLGVASPPAAP